MMEEAMDHFTDADMPDDAVEPHVTMLEDFAELPEDQALSLPQAAPWSGASSKTSSLVGGIDDLAAVFDVPVRIQAVLGRARMPIGELLRMKSGIVIDLDRKVGEPVDIFVNDRLIARGEVVLIDESLGITLTEIVQQDH